MDRAENPRLPHPVLTFCENQPPPGDSGAGPDATAPARRDERVSGVNMPNEKRAIRSRLDFSKIPTATQIPNLI